MILVVDNYDSFTYNLVQYLGELGAQVQVARNDALTVEEILSLGPQAIVISPGPGDPGDAGVSVPLIRALAPATPVLGVCLGHQCIGAAFGGVIRRASRLMHGKTSWIEHDGRTIFAGLPNPFEATRYHSLVVNEADLPCDLEVSARAEDGEVMALRHRSLPLEGVQFHPESILTREGKRLLRNFLVRAGSPAG